MVPFLRKWGVAMKRGSCALLAAAMSVSLLAGCAGKSREGTVREGLYYDASGICPDAVLMTVDGRDVSADRYFYWLTDTCDSISDSFSGQGKQLDWDMEFSGEKLGDYVKQQALSTTVLYAVIESWADKYECRITDKDQEGIDAEWNAKVSQYGGEETYLAALANLGLDKTTAEQLCADYYLYSHLYDVYRDKTSALHPDDTVLNTYAADSGYLTVDEILISTADVAQGDTAAMAEKRERAEMVLNKLNASSNPLEYFTTLAGTYSDDDRDTYPDGFTFAAGDGTMSDAFETAAKALEVDKWSGIVESDEGLYIILRKPLDMGTVSADYFDHLLQCAADSAEIWYSDAYDSISAADFYAAVTKAREKAGTTAPAASGGDGGILPGSSAAGS